MKHYLPIGLFGIFLTLFGSNQLKAQVTLSFADDLTSTSAQKKEKSLTISNKKVKLTNLENGKSVVIKINDRSNAGSSDKIANVSKSMISEAGFKSNLSKIKVEPVAGDDEVEVLWATAAPSIATVVNVSRSIKKAVKEKEIEIETTKIEGFTVNHIYDLTGKLQDIDGFGLQLAAFSQLKAAKEFASKLNDKNNNEAENIFIEVSKSADKPMIYRVIYGLFNSELKAKSTQKKMENLGYTSLVKGFK